MGWITISDTNSTDYRSAFASLHPKAVVEVSNSEIGIVAAVYEVGTKVCKIYATQHVKVTEYRGLSYDAAVRLQKGVATCSKVALRTTCGTSWAVVPMLVGTERTAVISRSNEAGGYKLTVTETTILQTTSGNISCSVGTPVTNGDVRVSWETGTSA